MCICDVPGSACMSKKKQEKEFVELCRYSCYSSPSKVIAAMFKFSIHSAFSLPLSFLAVVIVLKIFSLYNSFSFKFSFSRSVSSLLLVSVWFGSVQLHHVFNFRYVFIDFFFFFSLFFLYCHCVTKDPQL